MISATMWENALLSMCNQRRLKIAFTSMQHFGLPRILQVDGENLNQTAHVCRRYIFSHSISYNGWYMEDVILSVHYHFRSHCQLTSSASLWIKSRAAYHASLWLSWYNHYQRYPYHDTITIRDIPHDTVTIRGLISRYYLRLQVTWYINEFPRFYKTRL